MEFVIKAEMNGEVLAAELLKTAMNLPNFTVTPDLNNAGCLQSGSFILTPTNNLGVDGLIGKTYAHPEFPFELHISVMAIDWPEDTETAKTEALFSIFKPLVDTYNNTQPSKARILPRS